MAMTLNANDGDVIPEINTTPLIDVMLVLLTLLILTLPMQTNAVKITLPQKPLPPIQKPVVVDLAVEFDGTITWNGQAVDRTTLDAYLTRAAQTQPEIHLHADRLAKYDTVAKVLSDAQRFGLTKIGFADTNEYRSK